MYWAPKSTVLCGLNGLLAVVILPPWIHSQETSKCIRMNLLQFTPQLFTSGGAKQIMAVLTKDFVVLCFSFGLCPLPSLGLFGHCEGF